MADKPTAEPIYRVIFNNQSEVYELYALYIYQSEMYGFIEVEELLFDEKQFDGKLFNGKESDKALQDAGDKAEKSSNDFAKFKQQFSGVKRSFIPLTSIIRIDEMEKPGVVKVPSAKDSPAGNVRHFPSTGFKRPPVSPVDSPINTPEDSSTPPSEDN